MVNARRPPSPSSPSPAPGLPMKFLKGCLLRAMPCLALVWALSAASASAATSPKIELFSPEGTARQVRQVVARFSAPMVAVGDPRLPDPFDVSCPASGRGRWADATNWAYDFDEDLDAGVSCRFNLKPGLKALDGSSLVGMRDFRFNTGGPAIVASLPREGWSEIDEEQIFILHLDAPATPISIETNAYCAVDGIEERIPVRVLTGAERTAVLAQRKALGYDYMQLLWKSGATTDVRVRNRSMEKRDEVISVVRCQRRLPPATKVLLQWSAGIATASGIRTESDQQLAFRVRSAFIAQVECTRTNPRAGCMPMLPIAVNFTAPVPMAQALAIRLRTPRGALLSPVLKVSAQAPVIASVTFPGPFQESSKLTVILPKGLVDDSGRTLENVSRFPLDIRVDAYPPLVKFSGTFGILELREGGVLPVTLRNVEASLPGHTVSMEGKVLRLDADAGTIAEWLRRVHKAEGPSGYVRKVDPAKKDGESPKSKIEDQEEATAYGQPEREWVDTTGTTSVFNSNEATASFTLTRSLTKKDEEIVGIPLKKPGFYVIEVASSLLGASLLESTHVRYVSTAALVTDMAVHLKWGRESSLVWVTRLSDGTPVHNASVQISSACDGHGLWSGTTDSHGIATVQQELGAPNYFEACPWSQPLIVLARKGEDFSFTESTWMDGIRPYDFSVPVGSERSADIYHSVLDRSLFRPGETVYMKHFMRRHTSGGIAVLKDFEHTDNVEIHHGGSGQKYTIPVTFDNDGTGTNSWKIPSEARLGDYSITIDDHPSGTFKIEEFRLPTMRGSITGPPRQQVSPRSITFDLHVAYLSGGGAGGLPVKVRTLTEASEATYPGYDDYTFGGKRVVEGVTTSSNGPADFDFEATQESQAAKAQTIPLTLDANGSGQVTIDKLPMLDGPARLTAELEYADGNGETMTSVGYARLMPSQLSLGIKTDSWAGSPGQMRFRVVALDLDGKPKARHAVSVSLYQSSDYSYRKRMLGGFYTYETTNETRKLKVDCSGKTNEQGLLLCEVAPGVSGQVLVRAETRDAQGAIAGATSSMWVLGKDEWWFGGTSGDRMDVLPEKKEYESGEIARFQVRMPFREATALVTIEREGVLQSFVTELRGAAPVIEVPIEPQYSPNAFVSVLAVRGRIRHVDSGAKVKRSNEVTALVDLTKPAYRLGLAQIKVGWKPHRLDVLVHADQKTYNVRQHALVKIHVTPASGLPLPEGTEVAVAAVDEALLDLSPNHSWDLLTAMMNPRGLEVWTSTSQMQVVGKRHYGRKAVPQGGGGGREGNQARELFESLLYWKARVPIDANGDASVEVPLNDSLTSFRIVAVAHNRGQLYGTGSTTIVSTQELMLMSGLPPLLREGDRFEATFTVRNATDHTLQVHAAATSKALHDALPPIDTEVPGGHAVDIHWPVTVPIGVSQLDWSVSASANQGSAVDHLKVSEQVVAAYPVRTYQATITQLAGPLSMPVERPRKAIAGRGGLYVTLQAHLADSMQAVREYMSRYPYICFEQLASRAVVLRSHGDWDSLMRRLPAYLDGDGLIKYFPVDWLQGDDSLTAYILAISDESGYAVPEAERKKMLDALTRFVAGKLSRDSALPTADLSYRKLTAIEALSRHGAADAHMLDSLPVDANLLPTSGLLDWMGILERVQGISDADAKASQVGALLRARVNFQGTTMGFSTERSDALWWLMISADSNANRMLLAVMSEPKWKEDMPRLVRGSLGRQQSGHWNTTVANAWGVLAMEKFSASFESTPVSGKTSLQYGPQQRTVSWPSAEPFQVVDLPWQSGPGALKVTHEGQGRPWVLVRATAALPLEKPLFTGFKVERTVTPIEQQHAGTWSRGDVARIHLELDAQSDMSWVVVDDPVPAGSTVLGSGIGGQSALVQRGDRRTGWGWIAFEERRFDAYRAYYRFVPKGHWTVEYTARLNNPGIFNLPATRVEAMYAPEMFGELPNPPLTIQPAVAAP